MATARLLLIVRGDQGDIFAAKWPAGVQVVVERRERERRAVKKQLVAIQQRRAQRRRRPWADAGLDAQGAMLVRA